MIMQALLGIKTDQTQKFLENGKRIPVTQIIVPGNLVVQVKTTDKDGYTAIQFGIGTKKKANKPLLGHLKTNKAPQYLREVRVESENQEIPEVRTTVNVSDVFTPGDIIDVTGVSKGKGFAGGVKRYHFKGGPRTHGQSDRERAPGSIGQTTTPGRVYKGKRMAGNMGHEQVTVKNLMVVAVNDNELLIKGLVPGSKETLLVIKKVGENKNFTPLYKTQDETPVEPESVAPDTQQEPTTKPQETQEAKTTEPEHAEEVSEEQKDTSEAENTEKEEKSS